MPPLTTQYPEGMSDAWAHQTSMQRATGNNNANMLSTPYTAQLGAQSSLARDESEMEPGLATNATRLNDADATAWVALRNFGSEQVARNQARLLWLDARRLA